MIQKVTTFFKWWKDWPPTFWVNLTRRSTRGKLGSVVITILEISVTPFSRTTVMPSFDYIECRHFLREIWSPNLSKRQHFPQNWAGSHGTRSLWRTFIQRHHLRSFLQPKNNPTAPKKIPLETGKTEEPFTAGFPGFPPLRYITSPFSRDFFWGGHIFFWLGVPVMWFFLGGFPLHLRTVVSFTTKKMTNRETGKFSNVKSWPFKGWSCCRVDLHLGESFLGKTTWRSGWVELNLRNVEKFNAKQEW